MLFRSMTDTCEAIVALCTGIAGLCQSGGAAADFPTAGYSSERPR